MARVIDSPRTREKIKKQELVEVARALQRAGYDAKVFAAEKGGELYLAIKVKEGEAPHVFREVQSKQAAKTCGAERPPKGDNTIAWWRQIWEKNGEP